MSKSNGQGRDQYTLWKQRGILRSRRIALEQSPAKRHRLDEATLNELRSYAPLKLAPVLIQRNAVEFVAAYLIQRVGDANGYRFLVREDDWRICFARKSAKLVRIKPKQERAFARLVEAQEQYFSRLSALKGTK